MTTTQNISNILEENVNESNKTRKQIKNASFDKTVRENSPYQQIYEKFNNASIQTPTPLIENDKIKQTASKMELKFKQFLNTTTLKRKNDEHNNIERLNTSNPNIHKLGLSHSQSKKKFSIHSPNKIENLIEKGNDEINKLKRFKEELVHTQPLKCYLHNDFISLFCMKDKEILCANCVFNNNDKHKNHTILPLNAAKEIILKENRQFKKIAQEKWVKIDDSIKNCERNICLIEETFLKMSIELEKEFEDLKLMIEERKKQILSNLNRIFRVRVDEYNSKLGDLNYLKNCLKDHRYYEIDEKWDQNTCIYIYNINSMIKKTINNIDLHFKVLGRNDIEKINFDKKIQIKKEIDKFAEIATKAFIDENKCREVDSTAEFDEPTRNKKEPMLPPKFIQNQNDFDEDENSKIIHKKNHSMQSNIFLRKKSETERKENLKEKEMLEKKFGNKEEEEIIPKQNEKWIQNDILSHFKNFYKKKEKHVNNGKYLENI